MMQLYKVHVTIENKPGISDPEGQTILNDLVIAKSNTVKSIRTAKVLKFEIEATSGEEAISSVRKLCDDLRLYNPLVSATSIGLYS